MSGSGWLAAVATMLLLTGGWLIVAGIRRTPTGPAAPPRHIGLRGVLGTGRGASPAGRAGLLGLRRWSRRTRLLAVTGLVAGVLVWLLFGWPIAVLVLPVAVPGIPALLGGSAEGNRIQRLEAMEEWTRALAGVLTVGVGLEQAIIATLRSTPDPIRREVATLVARLRARWPTPAALKAFADDLGDATGDQIAASLLLGSTRRGAGLASLLEGLAQTVADDVRIRRAIEADRAKPRSTARWITIITLVVLGLLTLNGDYIQPYRTGIGQLLLVLLLGGYVACLVWLRRMVQGTPLPRFIGITQGITQAPAPATVHGKAPS